MDDLMELVELMENEANLSTSIGDVQRTIDLLTAAREKIAADPQTAPLTLAKLQDPLKKTMEAANNHLVPIYKGLGKYSKAIDKKFKEPLPTIENDALSAHPSLINRAIAMHLLREGEFDVASTFIAEASQHPPHPEPTPGTPNPSPQADSFEQNLAQGTFNSLKLQEQFVDMYNILHELKTNRNLAPAIMWARQRSALLEARGSNLEFELCQLQFICLFIGRDIHGQPFDGGDESNGPLRAWAYARSEFGPFLARYAKEVQHLMGAMAFAPNVFDSPYRRYFYNDSAWEEVAASFTREFCSLLGLSADSPLYIAATAGAIALPTLLKLQNIMKEKRTEWTTQNELPVEIPLPPSYHFHSIFVCPVSKEQSTDGNPPMMLPCGHVIAQESLHNLIRNNRFKCPYCPMEARREDATQVVL